MLNTSYNHYPFGSPMPNRSFSASSYRYGFNGKENDDEIKGGGNSVDFGARLNDPRLGRWWSADPKSGKYISWSPYHFGYDNPITTIDPNGEENIVIVGSQHDNVSANKLMFVHQALRQLKQYANLEKNESRTLILFTEGYTPKQIRRIEKEAGKLGATIVQVQSAKGVTNYINSKQLSSAKVSDARASDPVSNIDAFSHGVAGSIEFGYKTGNAAIAKFDKSSASSLNPAAFTSGALFCSYACRTGSGNKEINNFAWPGESDEAKNSLAQSIANSADINVIAYKTRTDYSATLGTSKDRLGLKLESYGAGSDEDKQFKKEVGQRENIDGATFDPNYAKHPVVGGTTPVNVSPIPEIYKPEPKK